MYVNITRIYHDTTKGLRISDGKSLNTLIVTGYIIIYQAPVRGCVTIGTSILLISATSHINDHTDWSHFYNFITY